MSLLKILKTELKQLLSRNTLVT